MGGGVSFFSMPWSPAAMVAAKARYGLASAPGLRFSTRKPPPPRHLAAEPLLEDRGALARAALGREEVAATRLVPQRGVEMKRGARRAHVVLRHEGHRAALLPGDLLHPVLVEHVAVGHLERV